MSEHMWNCDYVQRPGQPGNECYCPTPAEQRTARCGCLVDACCNCAEG